MKAGSYTVKVVPVDAAGKEMAGANGVIMVTTKRGNAGKTKIDFTQGCPFR